MEQLTGEIELAILERVAEIEAEGTATELFDRGWFRAAFHEAMVRFGQEVADGSRPVVGVNRFAIPDADDRLLREHTDAKISPCTEHIERIRQWKAGRPADELSQVLASVTEAASDPDRNLMPTIVDAFDWGATMGEITGAIRVAAGLAFDPLARHRAVQ